METVLHWVMLEDLKAHLFLEKNLLLLQVSIIGSKGFSTNVDGANPFSVWL